MNISENETTQLIQASRSNQGRVLMLSFGPGNVELLMRPENQWAIDLINESRRAEPRAEGKE